MPNDTPTESFLRRGWSDTRAVWTSLYFYVLDAVGGVVVGGIFGWYWGLSLVLFGMVSAWMGATARAPFAQRNEALAQRDEALALLRAIPGATPDAPKLAAPPELCLEYVDHEFSVANGTAIVSIKTEFVSYTGRMLVEAVDLRLVGKQIPSLNWQALEVSHAIWITISVQFDISAGVSPGEHPAELVAFANGEWWGPETFVITVPEVNS